MRLHRGGLLAASHPIPYVADPGADPGPIFLPEPFARLVRCAPRHCRAQGTARHLNIAGRGSFAALGEHNVMLCRSLGKLQRNDSVLDVGCGIGRTAMALTDFLSPDPLDMSGRRAGSYAGFDVIAFAIRWCRKHISKGHPQFTFLHANVWNALYNPHGTIAPDQYEFPFPAAEFNFCLATSVFTHLLPDQTEHYLSEIARTLRSEGRFLSTWFLLDDRTEAAISAGAAQMRFPHRFTNHAQSSLAAPEQAVAYRRPSVEDLFAKSGLKITGLHYGGWSGIEADVDSGQDVIVATRL